ncbi:hypothetical protein BCR36DRAFT_580190 [Piromyces finnis]|uniref:Uncharacterized protein n=1 Tax=Piromyces finnis TaxID=1754191 RepID=A0A1Y1VLD9_9FUNG|nr:hypothetical protein BCR36DRAFT_580190 [Piromyces finnis]|eukprot:ORX58588.1 hypothetical protein BCR36DRAFT_580190 [Piromyces finnis]
MKEMVSIGQNKILKPMAEQKCVLCNKYENRFIYQLNEKDFHKKGIYVCDLCIEEEMSKEEKLWRIR